MAILKVLNTHYSISDIENVIHYILQYDKRPIFGTNLLYTGINYKENICQQFYGVINYYNKTSSFSNVLHHLILSFDYNDECWINDIEAVNIVRNALFLLSFNNEKDHIINYQFVYSLHRDSSNIHLHIVINSVCPFNGRMINVNKNFIDSFTYNLKLLINNSKMNKQSEYLKKPPIDKDYDYVYDVVMNMHGAVITVVYE